MIQTLSLNITEQLIKNGVIVREDQEIYSYGLQQGVTMMLNILLSLGIGLAFGMVWQCVIFFIGYTCLRIYAGGYHAKTQLRCHIFSIGIIIIALLMIRYIVWTNISRLVVLLSSGAIIYFLSPMQDANKPLMEAEFKAYKNKVKIILGIQYVCMVFLLLFSQNEGLLSLIVAQMMLSGMLVLGKVKEWRYLHKK